MSSEFDFKDMSSAKAWRPDQPFDRLPGLPSAVDLETKAVLKRCIRARAALAELKQAATRYLKALVSIGVLREETRGREKLFAHPRLLTLLTAETQAFVPTLPTTDHRRVDEQTLPLLTSGRFRDAEAG